MKPRFILVVFLLCAASVAVLYPTVQTKPRVTPRMAAASQPRLVENYGRLPLAFEANRGQADEQVRFISRGRGYTMFLTGDSAVLSLRAGSQKEKVKGQKAEFDERPWSLVRGPLPRHDSTANGLPGAGGSLIQNPKSQIQNPPTPSTQSPAPSTLRLKLVGANPKAMVAGLDQLPGKSNYFIGNDPKKWRTNVANYAKVKYQSVYPGVDLVYYGNQGQLEYDFVVAPGANPGAIKLAIEGAEEISVNESGNLIAAVNGGSVVLNKPTVYQNTFVNPKSKTTNPKSVDGRFVLAAKNQITFELGSYDKTLPLVIDPVLSYATYLGGTDTDYSFNIAVDSAGNAYVTGGTYSTSFPVAAKAASLGCDTGGCGGGEDVYLTKLNPDGSLVLFTAQFGGALDDVAYGLVLGPAGNIYLSGVTLSSDFPTSASAFQKTAASPQSGFILKVAADGSSMLYSTYLGGNTGDVLYGLAVDSTGAAYVTGGTVSTNFPTQGALQPTFSGGMACGDFFSGYYDCPDAFITKLNADASALVYSTYLGRVGTEYGTTIAVDASGNAYVGGYTTSSDFPHTAGSYGGSYDGFLLKLAPNGQTYAFSTLMGGSDTEYLQTLVLDSQNNIYITGTTASSRIFSETPCQADTAPAGTFDAFLIKMNSSGSPMSSRCLGGSGNENGFVVTIDASDNVYMTGVTDSPDLPVIDTLQPVLGAVHDMFIAKFNAAGGEPVFLTYLGGGADEAWAGGAIAVDSSGNVYVTGETASTDFPVANAHQSTYGGGNSDAFVAKINMSAEGGLGLNPASLSFGDQATGNTSAAKTATLTNGGTQAFTINSIALSSGIDYAETHDGCPISPATLAGGAHCTISVTFTPTALGTLTDEVVVTSDASGSPHMLDLTGNGVPPAPAVDLSPPSLHFASQMVGDSHESQSVTLTNTGSAALLITSIASTTADFIIESNDCPLSPLTLAVDAPCTITVTFKPTARGDLTGSIAISDNAEGGGQSISLSGTGMIPAAVELSPMTLEFGNQLVGTTGAAQPVTLTNAGDGQFMIQSIAAGGDFLASSTTCSTSVSMMGGASCTITVTFAPKAPGTRDSTLTITHDAPTGPHTVTLKGTGTDFEVSIPSGEGSKTVTAGGTATYNLQLAPTGYSGPVALNCAFQGTTPRGAGCSVTPGSVTLDGVNAASFAVNATTTARSMAAPQGGNHRSPLQPGPWSRRVMPLLLALLAASLLAAKRRRAPVRIPTLRWVPLAATLLFVLLWAACGGGVTPPPQDRGTPAGTYNLTLTATTAGGVGVSKTSTLTLTVN